MKKILFSLLCFGFSIASFAQKTLPEIKAGSVLKSSVFVQGQEYPLVYTVKSIAAPIVFAWSVDGYGEGAFEITAKGLESGNNLYLTQPALGTTKLSDSETYGLISKTAYKTLMETKAMTYNNIKFKVKTAANSSMKMGGKEVDVTHIASEDGKIELWILNNPNLPLIVQTAGMPIDIMVQEIK